MITILDYLLYWIGYWEEGCFFSVVFSVLSLYCLIHCFIIITIAVFTVWPSLSSLVDPYVFLVRLIVYWFDYGTAPMSLLLLLLIFYSLIFYDYYFKSTHHSNSNLSVYVVVDWDILLSFEPTNCSINIKFHIANKQSKFESHARRRHHHYYWFFFKLLSFV